MKIEGRALEEWIDEGALRDEAAGATSRALGKQARRQRSTHLDPETAAEIGSVVRDPRRAAVLRDRLAQAGVQVEDTSQGPRWTLRSPEAE